jgi:hypothetical protein
MKKQIAVCLLALAALPAWASLNVFATVPEVGGAGEGNRWRTGDGLHRDHRFSGPAPDRSEAFVAGAGKAGATARRRGR